MKLDKAMLTFLCLIIFPSFAVLCTMGCCPATNPAGDALSVNDVEVLFQDIPDGESANVNSEHVRADRSLKLYLRRGYRTSTASTGLKIFKYGDHFDLYADETALRKANLWAGPVCQDDVFPITHIIKVPNVEAIELEISKRINLRKAEEELLATDPTPNQHVVGTLRLYPCDTRNTPGGLLKE